jgi:hypothetical protein
MMIALWAVEIRLPHLRTIAIPVIVLCLAEAAGAVWASGTTPAPTPRPTPSPSRKTTAAPGRKTAPRPAPSATPAPTPTAAATPAPSPTPATLAPLEFLVGAWEGAGGGAPGEGSGGFSFAKELQGRVLLRTSHANYPAVGGRPAFRHDDLMVIYADGAALKADYYDSEGHVIRYRVQPRAEGDVVFLGEAAASSPRYRLTYRLTPEQLLEGRFEIAPPATPEAFKPYLTWSARRAGRTRASAP